jgi:hypothetical protein
MISSQRQRQLTLLASLVHLLTDLPADLGDGTRVDHLADVRVLSGVELEEVVGNGRVVLDLPVERLELRDEAGREKGDGSGVDSGSFLQSGRGMEGVNVSCE